MHMQLLHFHFRIILDEGLYLVLDFLQLLLDLDIVDKNLSCKLMVEVNGDTPGCHGQYASAHVVSLYSHSDFWICVMPSEFCKRYGLDHARVALPKTLLG